MFQQNDQTNYTAPDFSQVEEADNLMQKPNYDDGSGDP